MQTEHETRVFRFLGGSKLEARAKKQGSLAVLRQGLPNSTVRALADRYGLADEAMSRIIGVSVRTLARHRGARGALSPTASDRAFRFARVAARIEDDFGDAGTAQDWLRSPNRALDGQPPLALMDTDAGIERIEAVLTRIEQGVYS